MSARSRAMLALFGITGALVAWLWMRRALRVYREEASEFTVSVSSDPLPEGDAAPPGVRAVSWTLAGAEQHGWYVPPRNGALVMYLHGSPGSRASLLPEARALARSRGYGALLVDLPGYGASRGARDWGPSYLRAARAALDFATARPEVEPSRVGLFGFSMGACISAQVAAQDPRVRALVLRGAFTRLDEQLRVQFRGRAPFVEELAVLAAERAGLNTRGMDTESALRALGERPVLLIAGAEDAGVPPAHSERLAAAALDPELWIVPGIGHLGFAERIGEPYFERVQRFFDRALAAPRLVPAR